MLLAAALEGFASAAGVEKDGIAVLEELEHGAGIDFRGAKLLDLGARVFQERKPPQRGVRQPAHKLVLRRDHLLDDQGGVEDAVQRVIREDDHRPVARKLQLMQVDKHRRVELLQNLELLLGVFHYPAARRSEPIARFGSVQGRRALLRRQRARALHLHYGFGLLHDFNHRPTLVHKHRVPVPPEVALRRVGRVLHDPIRLVLRRHDVVVIHGHHAHRHLDARQPRRRSLEVAQQVHAMPIRLLRHHLRHPPDRRQGPGHPRGLPRAARYRRHQVPAVEQRWQRRERHRREESRGNEPQRIARSQPQRLRRAHLRGGTQARRRIDHHDVIQ
mmetsp:Transcript_16313/g.42009  ORF Transcript_16313/g.42009 Transcript_16313/m.42009 type:complete len:331 (+) Transcript_16313:987-1979(+)